MAFDILPGRLVANTRQQLHDKYLQWVLVRNPLEDTRGGSQVDIDAWVWADAATMIQAQAVAAADARARANMRGPQLDAEAKRLGTQRLGAQPSAGAVYMQAGSNGATVQAGDVLTYLPTTIQYQVRGAGTYQNGDAVPVSCLSAGPQTNLPAGATLNWQIARPGQNSLNAVVIMQADGSGLSGGSPAEDDFALIQRLNDIAANPPASGNDADYQQKASLTYGVGIQQVFTFPCVLGPGSTGLTFTLRPSQPGASRLPNATQLSLVRQLLGGMMPASDGVYLCTLVASPTPVVLKTIWASSSPGWADSTLFPLYHQYVTNPGDQLVAASPNAAGVLSPLAFRLSSPAMTEVPQVGQNIGFFDRVNLIFRRKKILTVTVINATTCDVTVDTSNGVSDTSYAPANGQACCPWSDSLGSLVLPVVTYFDTLGPGEQFASFFDPGLRQKRSPASPQAWSSVLTNRLLGGTALPVPPQGPQQNQPAVQTLFTTQTLNDVELIEPAPPYVTPVGTPGTSSYLMTLSASFVAFPE